MRRCVPLQYLDDMPEEAFEFEVPTDRRWEYVSQSRDESPLGMLLWAEVDGCLRRAGLTELQAGIVVAHMQGFSDRQVAEALNRVRGDEHYSRQSVCVLRHLSLKKVENLDDLGVATVLFETFGLRQVRRALTESALEHYNLT